MESVIIEIGDRIRKKLPKKRFWHSVGVAYMAADMAAVFGEDQTRALTAGILHDCAKCLTEKEILAECRKYNIKTSTIEEEKPYLLHAKLGAYYAKEEYQINDPEILSAITWHTTGRPGMTVLEKIIYLADFVEPLRKQPTGMPLNEIRKLCFRDLDHAVFTVAGEIYEYLKTLDTEMDPGTEQTYLYYRELCFAERDDQRK